MEKTEKYFETEKYSIVKYIIIYYICFAFLFSLNIIISYKNYSNYKKGQEMAILNILAVSDRYNTICTIDNRKKCATALYSDLLYQDDVNYHLSGIRDNSFHKLDVSLGELLTAQGYHTYLGSDYLRFTSFYDYFITNQYLINLIFIVMFILTLPLILIMYKKSKEIMYIYDDKLIYKKNKKHSLEIFYSDISVIENCHFHGIKIYSNNFKFKILFIKNIDFILDEIKKGMKKNKVK